MNLGRVQESRLCSGLGAVRKQNNSISGHFSKGYLQRWTDQIDSKAAIDKEAAVTHISQEREMFSILIVFVCT